MTPTQRSELVARLRTTLPVCPFDKRSPDYWTDFRGKPCPVCGGTEDGEDKCRGADTRCMGEAADALDSDACTIAELRDALDPFLRVARLLEPLDLPPGKPLRDCIPGAWPTVGDLRRARAVLEKTEGGK